MNKFKNYAWMAAGFTVLVAVVSGITAGPAIAQLVKAALVKNVDERGRVPYMVQLHCASNNSNGCSVTFPVVPAGRRLVIEHLNATLQQPGQVDFFSLFINSTDFSFAPKLVANDGFDNNFAVNEPVLAYVEAGNSAVVQITALSIGVNMTVILSGYLVDLTI